MKTLEQILKQEPVYLNDWKARLDVIADFEDIYLTQEEYEAESSPYSNVECWLERKAEMNNAIKKYEGINIIFASYGCANWSGDAWVLFEQDGKLFEVNGGHCSCYGLEDQFEPEETTLEAIEYRLLNGTWGEDSWSDNNFKQELCEFLGVEFRKNLDR